MKVHKFNIFLIITVMTLIICCKKNKKPFNNIVIEKRSISNIDLKKDNNLKLLKGLQRLKQVIEDSNNEGFADFFIFPTKKYYYVSPIKAIESFKDSMITKDYFIKNSYVPNINQDPSLDNLLGKLDLNLLKFNDVIKKSFEIENDECSYFYKIEIIGKSVKLIYKSISNPKYEDNEYSCEPESDTIYMKMKGNRLFFDQEKIEMSYESPAG